MTLAQMTISGWCSSGLTYLLIAAMSTLTFAPLSAAEPASPQQRNQAVTQDRVENMQVVINGGVANVSYDLISRLPAVEVRLEASRNGGSSYDLIPKTVTGDIGARVAPGTGKKIVWEASKDTDILQLSELRFRVSLGPNGPARSESGAQGQAGTQPPVRPPAPPLIGATPEPSVGKKNSLLWPGIAVIGAGAYLSIAGATGPLKKVDPAQTDCEDFYNRYYGYVPVLACDYPKLANKPIIGVGVGVAAAGAVLLFLGKHRAARAVSIAPRPKGVFVYHVFQFDWPD